MRSQSIAQIYATQDSIYKSLQNCNKQFKNNDESLENDGNKPE